MRYGFVITRYLKAQVTRKTILAKYVQNVILINNTLII